MVGEAGIEESLKQLFLGLSVFLSIVMLPQVFSWFHLITYTLLLVILGLNLASIRISNSTFGRS